MESELAWLLLGLGLVVVELLTGTFYLLILGGAALVGALVGYLGAPLGVEIVVVAVAAIAGVYVLRQRKARAPARVPSDNQMDVGQTVVVESWISEPQRLARVLYRGAPWEAEVLDSDSAAPGSVLYVVATEGSRLKVSARRAT
jgi:membrane protein implicated in regulation of membrane protease activity